MAKKAVLIFVVMTAVLLVWQTAAAVTANVVILPGPLEVWNSFMKIMDDGLLFKEAGITTARGLTALLVTMSIGIVTGILCGINGIIKGLVMPAVTFVQATPVISWLLVALIWFDNKNVPLFVIIISTMPTVIINIAEGIERTDPKLLEMAGFYNVGLYRVIRDIYIPSLSGYIAASCRIVLGLTFKIAVMAEVIAHPGSGIGERMNSARLNIETAEIIAWTIIIILITFIFDSLVNILLGKAAVKR